MTKFKARGLPQQPAEAIKQVGALRLDMAGQSLAVDLGKLDPPERAYDADVAFIDHRVGSVTLLFGKIDRDAPEERLRNRLEIRYPPEDFLTTFWGPSLKFTRSLARLVETWPLPVESGEAALRLPASQSHSEWASFTYMSHSGTDAAIDFYHVSSSALARWQQARETTHLKLRPILRVQVSIFTLHALLVQAEVVDKAIRQYLPTALRRDLPAAPETDSETEA